MTPKFTLAKGHVFLHVDDIDQALKFYRDVLGITIQRTRSDWIDLAPTLGFSLSKGDEELIEFHVDNFEETANRLERAGLKVERKGQHSGRITDPFGNIIGLHDHRQ